MKESHPHNIQTLESEIEWFTKVLNHQFHAYFNQAEETEDIDSITPPHLKDDDSNYARVVNENQLGYKERLAIMLAMMPHLQPKLLDIFFTKNAHFDRGFTEFGGHSGKRHIGFLPTAETLHFLLSRGAVCDRCEVLSLFDPEHVLIKKDIIRLERAESYEPALSSLLTVTEEFLAYVTTGHRHSPESNDAFPAKLVTTALNWEDLVMDAEVLEEIDLIRQWIQSERKLMHCETFRKHIKPGFRALFHGPPGTGKTLTACLLGKVTGLDVYRVDLSLIVSKYIGETEKNLARIFDYAQKRNWILFFDEADALFGKRTQTNSSNDRYANQEVSYLLQRIEDFPGVIILASNLKANIDEAFSRRFQSMMYFPMPTKEQRVILWKQFFSGTIKPDPTIDFSALAEKYELSGGSAINVFRYSALRAANRQSTSVTNDDVMRGILREFQKYGRTI